MRHAHLGHGAPAYRPAEDDHVHVVCHACGSGRRRRPTWRWPTPRAERGFASTGHFTVFGRCAAPAAGHSDRVRCVTSHATTSTDGRPEQTPADRDAEARPMTVPTWTQRASRPPGVDAGVAWHYGDPLREQRALATGAGLVDRCNRDVLRRARPRPAGWLHSICSQHLTTWPTATPPRRSCCPRTGTSSSTGSSPSSAGTVWIDTEPGAAPRCSTTCRRCGSSSGSSRPTSPPTGRCCRWSGRRPRPCWPRPACRCPPPVTRARSTGGGFVRRMAWPGRTPADAGRARRVPPRACDARARLARRRRRAGRASGPSRRCASRRAVPRLGFETDHRTIPHEVGWIGDAVHLDKGCYRGQETVARVHNLGKPPRRLVLLHLSGESDELPAARHAGRAGRPHRRLRRHRGAPLRARPGRAGRRQAARCPTTRHSPSLAKPVAIDAG